MAVDISGVCGVGQMFGTGSALEQILGQIWWPMFWQKFAKVSATGQMLAC
jgi:hypothetical protein